MSQKRQLEPVLQSYSSRCLADIEPQPVRWLWPRRVALGKLNLLAGQPGRGKSTLTLYMAALVSNGGIWPDGSPCPRGNVAFITCEDDPADTLVPRLKAVGADLTRCHLLDSVHDDKVRERPFNLKTDAAKIEELAHDKGGLSLIIIDPISAYLNGIDSHNVAEVRGALVPLQQIAERLSATVVMVSHFNKGTPDGSAMSRVAGSGAFVAVCRSAWVVERDPENPNGNQRILAPMKNNIGDDRTGFSFVIEHCDLGNGIEGSRVCFKTGSVQISADQLVRAQMESADKRSALGEATAFLSDLLTDLELPQMEIEAAAKRSGHKMRTVQRAKAALGIKSSKRADGWWWEVPRKPIGGPGLFDEQERQGRQESHVSEQPDVGIHDCEEDRVDGDHGQDCQAFEPERVGALGNVGDLETSSSWKRVT